MLLLASMILVSTAQSQPPGYELEHERGSWCDIMVLYPTPSSPERFWLMELHEADALGEPGPISIPTLKVAGDGIPLPGDLQLLINSGCVLADTDGFDMSFYAINCRSEKAPLDDPVFRTALAYCINKDEIVPQLFGALATPLYNFVPPAQGFWYNPEVADVFPRFNLQTAIDTLIGGGYTPVLIDDELGAVPNNIDSWKMPDGSSMRSMAQTMPVVASPLAESMALWILSDLHRIGLPIYHFPKGFNWIVYGDWLYPPYDDWDLTVGISFSLGTNPFLYEMFNVESIPAWNIWGLNDPTVNDRSNALRMSETMVDAQQYAFETEEALVDAMPIIPIMSSRRYTAYTGPYDAEPGVLGWVNMKGHGGYNLWSALYSRREDPEGEPYQYNRWIMGEAPGKLNPLTSDTAYDWQVLSLVYSTLLQRNPYTHQLMPWCVEEMPVIQWWNGTHREVNPGVWVPDPSPVGSPGTVAGEYMSWTLRNDMTWHDGTEVNAFDVEFCLDLLVNQNNERYASIQTLIHDVNIPNPTGDPYTFEVYYTGRYPWAEVDISHVALLAPEHIWAPYIAGPDQTLWTADDRHHRMWMGHEWVSKYGYSAPVINTPVGSAQLTHLQGNGPFVYPQGGMHGYDPIWLVRWYDPSTETGWHYTRILRGDNTLDGVVDVLDLYAPLYAFGTQPGMPKWLIQADMANPAAFIDGRDIERVFDEWFYHWYP